MISATQEEKMNFYKAIIDTTDDLISIFDQEGKSLFFSKAYEKLLGKPVATEVGKHFSSFLEKRDKTKFQKACKNLDEETRVPIKHKVVLDGEVHVNLKSDIKKNDSLYIVTSSVISEKDINLKKIVGSENLWKSLSDSIPDFVTITDQEGVIIYVNHYSLTLTEKDVIGKKFTDFFYPDEREEEWKVFKEVLNSKKVIQNEKLVHYPDKTSRWFHSSIGPLIIDDELKGAIIISKDINEQKTREHTILESEERFRQLVESANDIIYRTDYSGNFVYINPEASKIFGYSIEELKNLHYSVLIREEYVERVSSFYNNQFINRTPNTYYEFPMRSKDGKEIWLGQNVQILTDGDWVLGFQALARDITTRKRIENELKLAKKEAEESSKAKQEFLSTMSHEIRTPLNAVIGLTNLLSESKIAAEEHQELIQGIKISADNLLHIINDILDFSKIESGKFSLENTPFELNTLLSGVKQSFTSQVQEKGIELIFDSNKVEDQLLQGDPIRISQILLNLISNAVKFTKVGKVVVDVQTESTSTEDIWLNLKVSDTGIGIPRDQVQSIFDSFSQASKSTTRKYGGTGLGLTITNMLVRMMKGTIKVDSAPNKGSVFEVKIKLQRATRDDIPTTNSDVKTDSVIEGKTILLVEDNQMNQLVASRYMRRWGAMIDVANNGLHAIELLKKKRFDLILMDLEMPDMDGYETTRYIRNRMEKPYNEIPIIAITASAFVSVKEKVLRFGMDDYVTKPFDPAALKEKISNTLLGRKPSKKDNSNAKSHTYISPDGKLYNLAYLMEASAGDYSFVEKMIKTYLNNTPKYLDELKKWMMQNNFYELKRVAHKFKATVTIVGVKEIEDLIDELESNIMQNKNLEKLPMIVEKIIAKGNKSVLELQEEINQSI